MRLDVDGFQHRLPDATICRLFAEGTRWRVKVESWDSEGGVSGRFVFEPDGPMRTSAPRITGPALRADRREAVISAAYEVPEERLRELLRSLS